jgi:hypothetical protein
MGEAYIYVYDGTTGEGTVFTPEPEGDVAGLAKALDAQIDATVDALNVGNVDQAQALLTGAGTTSDALLEALGLPDADDTVGGY